VTVTNLAEFFRGALRGVLARTLRPTGPADRAATIAELRRFYRLSREPKFRYIEQTA
jgi:hypothetical protein